MQSGNEDRLEAREQWQWDNHESYPWPLAYGLLPNQLHDEPDRPRT